MKCPRDGSRLIAPSYDGRVRIFDAATHELLRSLEGKGGVRSANLSRDGRWLAAVSGSDSVFIFRGETTADEPTKQHVSELLDQFAEQPYSVRQQAMQALEHIGAAAIPQLRKSAGSDSAEVRWRSRELIDRLSRSDNAITFRIRHAKFRAVALSPDGRLVAAGDAEGRICVWNVKDRQQVANFVLTEPPGSVE